MPRLVVRRVRRPVVWRSRRPVGSESGHLLAVAVVFLPPRRTTMRCHIPIAALLALAGCYNMPGGEVNATDSGANTVNGSIHVPTGTHSGSVQTVNGSIRIDDNATVASAGTVNGSVALGAHATADTIGTVNGSITLGEGARVTRDVSTVNGAMIFKSGADVGGPVSNVNGHIALNDAHVAGG